MGLDSKEEDWEKPFYKKIFSAKDTNPLFSLMYHIIPGARSSTLTHDMEMRAAESKTPFYKTISIPGSFAMTYYSLIGQPFSKTERK